MSSRLRRPKVPNQQTAGRRTPWLVLVGGFLGAGKTTLLLAAAHELERRGLRCAVVLNDQSDGLVDTSYAELNGLASDEVTGGCFCCRLSDLVNALDRMRAHGPDVIFAEPVGSCTDISATILHPLEEYGALYRLAPYSVLVDPERARDLLRAGADENLAFLFRKQIAEADLVCFTKADVSPEAPDIGAAHVRRISARTGRGVAAWLDEVLYGDIPAGREILDIDYARYARAEAALAWLNMRVTLRPACPATPACVLGPLLEAIDAGLVDAGISVVHLKAIVRSESGFVKAALCGNGLQPEVEGMLDASPASRHELLLNLRCVGEAATAKAIVEQCLAEQHPDMADCLLQAFHPAAPTPERRMTRENIAQKGTPVSATESR